MVKFGSKEMTDLRAMAICVCLFGRGLLAGLASYKLTGLGEGFLLPSDPRGFFQSERMVMCHNLNVIKFSPQCLKQCSKLFRQTAGGFTKETRILPSSGLIEEIHLSDFFFSLTNLAYFQGGPEYESISLQKQISTDLLNQYFRPDSSPFHFQAVFPIKFSRI